MIKTNCGKFTIIWEYVHGYMELFLEVGGGR
jgi:hypothetical protein